MNWLGSPAHVRWLESEADRLFAFGRPAAAVPNGFGWLDDAGVVRPDRPTQLWVTSRMTHVYSLAALMGRPGAAALVDHGLAALNGPFRDVEHGGWFPSVGSSGAEETDKPGYPHSFLVLGAASAAAAGRPGARELLDDALAVSERYFWDETEGMVLESWDRAFTTTEDYRGGNVSMHSVEAFLAAADVTGNRIWLDRAMRIAERMIHQFAAGNSYRVIEHFDANWHPIPDYNIDVPAHRFRAYGSTPGHWVEWARLLLHARASLEARGDVAPEWMVPDAESLFAAAIRDAWSVDGSVGLVYTVGWDGQPIVHERIRWVIAEAIAAAAALFSATGDPQYASWYQTFWDYAAEHFIDYAGGSWWQELDRDNEVSHAVWDGKPDLYHLMHAVLIPRLPLAPAMAPALAAGLLDVGRDVDVRRDRAGRTLGLVGAE